MGLYKQQNLPLLFSDILVIMVTFGFLTGLELLLIYFVVAYFCAAFI